MRKLRIKDYLTGGAASHYAEVRLSGRFSPDAHIHDFVELFWTRDAEGIHHINDTQRPLPPGSLVFVAAADRHTFDGRGMLMTNIAFSADTWNQIRTRYLTKAQDPFAGPFESRHFVLASYGMRRLILLAGELKSGVRTRIATDRFLLNLLELLVGECRNERGASAAPAWLNAALEKLRHTDIFVDADGLRTFFDLCNRTPEHVARETRRWFGHTPTDLVNEIRLERSAQRLLTSSDKILSIAMDCGFGNLGHFYDRFAARYGMSPGRYRRLHGQILGIK